MSLEWRNGQMLNDEELEQRYVEWCEAQKAPVPKTRYDVLIFWVLAILGCLSFWAFMAWMLMLRASR